MGQNEVTSSQQQSTSTTTQSGQSGSTTSGGSMNKKLRGLDLAQQEAMLTPKDQTTDATTTSKADKKLTDPPWLKAMQESMSAQIALTALKWPIATALAREYLDWKALNLLAEQLPVDQLKDAEARMPTVDEVALQLLPYIEMTKTLEGWSPTQWTWTPSKVVSRDKTGNEKLGVLGEAALGEVESGLQDKLLEALGRATVKIVGEELITTAVVSAVTQTWEFYGMVMIVVSAFELYQALTEKVDTRSFIMRDFQQWLDEMEGRKKPFEPPPLIETLEPSFDKNNRH